MHDTAGSTFDRLVGIVRTLRAPGGCPWDREQTLASLRPFVLEETYEVLEAIEHGTSANLCEELGDYLYEAVFLARICEESGAFTIADVVTVACDKLVRRHPHVFDRQPDDQSVTTDQVVERWETMKARERAAAGAPADGRAKTTLSGIPRALPSLLRAYESSARAAAVGFDWVGPVDVLDKLDEEIAEIREAVQNDALGDTAHTEEEVGDLLFAIANLSRKLGIEPEAALRRAIDKFTQRFDAMERAFAEKDRRLGEVTLDEMEAEWARVKAAAR